MARPIRTPRLIQALAHGLQLRLELLVLDGEPPVGVLQERFQVLDTLVSRKKLALGDPSFLLEGRVLVHELEESHK